MVSKFIGIILLGGLCWLETPLLWAQGGEVIGFERTGHMITIPTADIARPGILNIGSSFGIRSFTQGKIRSSNAFYINFGTKGLFEVGITAYQPYDSLITDTLTETSFALHFQKLLYASEAMAISLGAQDIIFRGREFNYIPLKHSLYLVASRRLFLWKFNMDANLGVGTRRFMGIDQEPTDTFGSFVGLSFNFRGVNVMAELASKNFNMGVRWSFIEEVSMMLALTQIEDIPKGGFGGSKSTSRFTLGFVLNIPQFIQERPLREDIYAIREAETYPFFVDRKSIIRDSLELARARIDSLELALAKTKSNISTIIDSLVYLNYKVNNLENFLLLAEQNVRTLEDSLTDIFHQENLMRETINMALKHLSLSLRYFYAGNYSLALAEVQSAIEVNPNIALAHARLGSIYYKMGYIKRATDSWKKALDIDPDYDDVRNILIAMGENRLMSTELPKR